MTDTYPTSPRSRVRRRPERASYDAAAVHAVLDAGLVAHVAYVIDGQPFVTPTAYWREGRRLYWHGAAGSRMLQAQAAGLPVCVAVTHLDGLIAARSAFMHSIQFRSVMAFGRTRLIEDPGEKAAAMAAFLERLYPGRTREVRPPSETELKQIAVVEMTIEEAAAKTKANGAGMIPADEAWPVWSGVIPISTLVGEPQADALHSAGLPISDSLAAYVAGGRLSDILGAAGATQPAFSA
jgi:hypothetical protein